jgi:hypothetical protein
MYRFDVYLVELDSFFSAISLNTVSFDVDAIVTYLEHKHFQSRCSSNSEV